MQFPSGGSFNNCPSTVCQGSLCTAYHQWWGHYCWLGGEASSSSFKTLIPTSDFSTHIWYQLWQLGFPGKYHLTQRLVCKKFIRECSWDQPPVEGKEAGLGREKGCSLISSTEASAKMHVVLKLGWMFRVVVRWDERSRPLYTHVNQLLRTCCLKKGSWPWARWFSAPYKTIWRGWQLKTFWQSFQKLKEWVQYSWRDIWALNLCINATVILLGTYVSNNAIFL